jgi:N-acyl-D-aspartate/D-glutamate deacylase
LFDPAQSIILTFPGRPEYAGKTVKDIATMNHESEAKALMRIIRESGASDAALAGASMSEEDIENFLAWDHTNICSDGTDGGHPRGYGSFTRILGYYVREKKLFPLETAIHRMTGLTAEHLGITNRGVVARGNFADLVLFNPATVKDNATMDDPTAQSSGIERVWVNGQQVLAGGRPVAGFPGQFITAASGRR